MISNVKMPYSCNATFNKNVKSFMAEEKKTYSATFHIHIYLIYRL